MLLQGILKKSGAFLKDMDKYARTNSEYMESKTFWMSLSYFINGEISNDL